MKIEKVALNNFSEVDVRRLQGILIDMRNAADSALDEMEGWLLADQNDITLQEVSKRLSYQLQKLGLK